MLCADCEAELNACRLLPNEAASTHEPLTACVSAFAYVGGAKELVRALKFSSDRAASIPLAAGICDAYVEAPELHAADVVVPVPLHPKRERERGYNQAELIAAELCGHIGFSMSTDLLRRVRNTKPQSEKSREQRLVGVSGAFEASGEASGAHVLLIDDVLSTGSTLIECAKALIMAGAAGVMALTAARSGVGMQIN